MEHPSIIFKIVCPDRPGLVSLLTSWISNYGGNIKHSDHHTDQDAGLFLSRIEWNSNNASFNRDEIYKQFHNMWGPHRQISCVAQVFIELRSYMGRHFNF